jgi:hypothetical protein
MDNDSFGDVLATLVVGGIIVCILSIVAIKLYELFIQLNIK